MAKPTPSEGVADKLADLMLDQKMPLRRALDKIGMTPKVYARMIARDEEFKRDVMEIREAALVIMEDELMEIADDPTIDKELRASMTANRRWVLGRRVERFRDKQDITSAGKPILLVDI